MRRWFRLLMCALALFCVASGSFVPDGKRVERRILFVGNSFTYFNNMPLMLQGLAQASGVPLTCRMQAEGAATLQLHWDTPGWGKSRVLEKPWTYVVLQEQSSTPVHREAFMQKYAALFCKLIREKGASPVLFLTWGYREDGQSGGVDASMQKMLNLAYARCAEQTQALLVPVGPAWVACLREHPKANLYAGDGQHPGVLGSYLTACVFYSSLFQKSPVGLPGTMSAGDHVICRIPDAQARVLQEVAWKTCREFSSARFLKAYQREQDRMVSVDELAPKLTRQLTYDGLVALIGQPEHANRAGRVYQFRLRGRTTLIAMFGEDMRLLHASASSEEQPGIRNIEVR